MEWKPKIDKLSIGQRAYFKAFLDVACDVVFKQPTALRFVSRFVVLLITGLCLLSLSTREAQGAGSSSPSRSSNTSVDLVSPKIAPLQEGDLIFQKSQSYQAPAIAEATASPWSHVGIIVKQSDKWYVAEAIQPVTATELSRWILRGKDKEYIIYRHKKLSQKLLPQLYAELEKYQGIDYDIYFEWSNDRIYCSELVYKVFEKVLGKGVGNLQKMKEMNLTGPLVQELIRRRLTDLGKELNPEEWILTPISQMQDPDLDLVFHYTGGKRSQLFFDNFVAQETR